MDPLSFDLESVHGLARVGKLRVRGIEIPTPAFMPVGTMAAVKVVEPEALQAMGYRLILANAYHLLVRPGPELIRRMGGLRSFMSWTGALLTDSGGYQLFSLRGLCKVSEEQVSFRSHLDGSLRSLSPERAMEVQEAYGSDILMPLDICSRLPAERPTLVEAMERTTRWLRRSIALDAKYQQMASTDSDFDAIRDNAAFRAVVGDN